MATPLLIQYDRWQDAAAVLGLIAFFGMAAERVYGPGRLVVIYTICGVVGQAFGYLWEPPDAGASVAGAGLLGAVSAWLLSVRLPRAVAGTPARGRSPCWGELTSRSDGTCTARLLVGSVPATLMRIWNAAARIAKRAA